MIPGLAECWEIADGGKTITFHLRKGVKFHSNKEFKPTRDFNADDVLFSFNRQWKPDNPYYKVSGGKYDYFNDMDMPSLLDTIEKKDDYTLVFHLKSPNVAILANLAMDFAAISSAEYADFLLKKGTPEMLDQAPIGTGAFSFVSYQKDAVIRFKKNPDYFGEKALVDDLVYAITPDATARYAKLQAGECHVNAYPRPADLRGDAEGSVAEGHQHVGSQRRLLGVQRCRSRRSTRKRCGRRWRWRSTATRSSRTSISALARRPSTLIPRTMWAYDDQIPQIPYDPEKAKQMLVAAGVKTPLDIDLWYMPVSRPYNPNGKRIGEMMQADLAKIGVNAKLQTYEWGEYRKRMANGEPITGQYGWTGDNGDPDNFFFLRGCPGGKPGNSNRDEMVQRRVRRSARQGAGDFRSGRARQAL